MSTAYPDVMQKARLDSFLPWKPNATPVSHLNRSTIQAAGRDKAMNNEDRDEIDNVIYRLNTLNTLFEFYWFAIEKVDFTKDSLEGIHLMLNDCIDKLRQVAK